MQLSSVLAGAGVPATLVQMQSPEQSSAYRVKDGVQAAAFANPARCRMLIACTLEERSLSQLQAEFGMPFSKLHYHVDRLLKAGLLVISRSQARAGRAVNYYRAVAESFLVSDVSHTVLPGDIWAAELHQLLREEMNRDEWGLLYAPDPRGRMLVRLVRPPQSLPPRTFENWRVLKLNSQQRAALAKELVELFERYSGDSADEGAETILLHTAFAPRKPA